MQISGADAQPLPSKPIGNQRLMAFHQALERDTRTPLPQEARLIQRLEQLNAIPVIHPALWWLSCARLAELTLICAGQYADNCQFAAAGDLLLNPRQVAIFFRHRPGSVIKARHTRVRDLLKGMAPEAEMSRWLSENTLSHIQKPALLPHLSAMLAQSGHINPQYLDSLETRMARVADTLAFLNAWGIETYPDLLSRIQNASFKERSFFQRQLCRFDRRFFHGMGSVFRKLASEAADRLAESAKNAENPSGGFFLTSICQY